MGTVAGGPRADGPAGGAPAPGHERAVRLRDLRHDDFDRVLELERALFGAGAWTYGMLADELAALGRWYVVAETALPDCGIGTARRPVVGYAGLWFDGDVTQVMTVGVDPAWQRRGVGRALMEALVARSRELRAQAVFLEVRVDNEPAITLYESLGFARLGVRKRYYQPEDKDAYTMRLLLTGEETP
ncbi:ribosomal-protein-alanine N-acetyltransferase [Xylanimonas oleitrophica]|uniref:Ribosomal-protein-alanine N-acetyltransferase n=1 Tax=Xylanimonas oleitrophica TaxID=2607479 RepID=A0A2W5WWD1_9MICO|nr:ribosomal protein S18-alanine N-acetyltransferase [Xylanimonas oleitrophica]PZR54903.1 ribosomal-protein-alanine N-acetyltransferase [Xylanimonas oleitrophica]